MSQGPKRPTCASPPGGLEGTMWNTIADAYDLITQVSFYTGFMVFSTVALAFLLVRLVLDSTVMAVLYLPAMAICALASNYLFHAYFLGPLADKHSNIVIASTVGVIIAIFCMMLATRGVMGLSDRRRRKLSSKLAGAVRLHTANPNS
jgi:hypothetical protein